MSWGTGMSTEEIMAEYDRHRKREIQRLRALALYYNAEADRLEGKLSFFSLSAPKEQP